MRIDWTPDKRADAAERIAYHTQAVIKAMDEAKSATQVRAIVDDWWKFAREHRVCQQIVDHIATKRKLLIGEFDKPKTRTMTDTSRRITGEHVE